ncbi:centromere protein Q isoform X3 [Rhineura floridana]|uniref:centromere protein Q isoform X3 n=1 Tax=Rhineura floridana TaxID=261503 RepID=UPI002AC88085|nr:centromere protein Q isoform X3 [Rhineura floridana]
MQVQSSAGSSSKEIAGHPATECPILEQGAQAIQKKEMQQRTQSPEAETTYLSSNVVKVTPSQRAKWQPLPKSTREHLESMMHWLIISLLYEATRNRNEIEKHLNILKKRLMKHFETLRVPMEKLSRLKNVHKMLAEEKKKSVSLEDGLAELQDEIDKVLPAAELRDENIHSLQNKVQELKRELAAEEAAASELFQTDGNDGLALPDISQYQLKAPILQDELLKTGNQEGLLNDLNTIQESEEMKTMLAFLEQAYENVDF